MAEHILKCRLSDTDHAEGFIDGDGDVRLRVHSSTSSYHVYARPAEFAEFARKVLADAGERLDVDGGPIRVGDYVEITTYRSYDHRYDGYKGKVTELDIGDGIPYLVNTDTDGEVWAVDVRKVDEPSTNGTRSRCVDQARTALAGTNPTAADIIRLAEFLAVGA